MRIACFTGHRSIMCPDKQKFIDDLYSVIRKLHRDGITVFRTGGAMGFDTIAALAVIELKKEFDIKLHLILPCRDQDEKWDALSRDYYRYIMTKADKVEYVTDRYMPWCMHERDRRLVDGSDVCVAYCTHNGGGTAYTMAYALKQHIKVINIA